MILVQKVSLFNNSCAKIMLIDKLQILQEIYKLLTKFFLFSLTVRNCGIMKILQKSKIQKLYCAKTDISL